jgi:hypothetical protein
MNVLPCYSYDGECAGNCPIVCCSQSEFGDHVEFEENVELGRPKWGQTWQK